MFARQIRDWCSLKCIFALYQIDYTLIDELYNIFLTNKRNKSHQTPHLGTAHKSAKFVIMILPFERVSRRSRTCSIGISVMTILQTIFSKSHSATRWESVFVGSLSVGNSYLIRIFSYVKHGAVRKICQNR